MNKMHTVREQENDSGGGGGGGTTLLSRASSGNQGGSATPPADGGGDEGGGTPFQGPWYGQWVGEGGRLNKSALEFLPDKLKPYKALLERFDMFDDALFSFGHSESLNARKGLMPLPEHASEKDKAEFRKRLAEINRVPEKPEDYGLKKPDGIPDDQWDGEYIQGIQAIAHKHAISPQALAELAEFTNARGVALLEAQEAAKVAQLQETETALKQEWQGNYGENLRTAMLTAKTYGLDPDDPLLGNHAGLIKALATIGKKLGSHNLITDGDGSPGRETPQMRVDSMYNDPQNPWYRAIRDSNDPRHREAHQLVTKLLEQQAAMNKMQGR